MFNLNENNQFFISNLSTDMRLGINKTCGKVLQWGRIRTDGMVYVFVGKTRKIMKLLHWKRENYMMCYKRLGMDRFALRLFPACQKAGAPQIRWDELVL